MTDIAVALRKICAWCDREMSSDGIADGEIVSDEEQRDATHGICKECAGRVYADYERRRVRVEC